MIDTNFCTRIAPAVGGAGWWGIVATSHAFAVVADEVTRAWDELIFAVVAACTNAVACAIRWGVGVTCQRTFTILTCRTIDTRG